jgi:hypothetical protein
MRRQGDGEDDNAIGAVFVPVLGGRDGLGVGAGPGDKSQSRSSNRTAVNSARAPNESRRWSLTDLVYLKIEKNRGAVCMLAGV